MADTPALTTTFTPPSTCLSETYREGDANVLGNVRSSAKCLPSSVNPLETSFYSPGLLCPAGYTKACSSIVQIGDVKETRATCCPSGFSCKPTDWWYWSFDSSYGCSVHYTATTTQIVTTSSGGAYQTTQHVMRGDYDYLNAYSVQIRWQSDDLSLTDTSSSIPSTSGVSGSAAAASTNGTTSATAVASSSGGGLSTGAKIGLGVGIPLGIIFIALIAFGIIWRRRKRAAAPVEAPSAYHTTAYHQPPMNQYSGYSTADPKYGQPNPSELDASGHIVEAPDTSRYGR